MTIEWDGITKSEVIRNDEIIIHHQLADAARDYNWNKTLAILNKRLDLINVTRQNGQALYTPLHQAAHGNAPIEVVQQMGAMGAWRTLALVPPLPRWHQLGITSHPCTSSNKQGE